MSRCGRSHQRRNRRTPVDLCDHGLGTLLSHTPTLPPSHPRTLPPPPANRHPRGHVMESQCVWRKQPFPRFLESRDFVFKLLTISSSEPSQTIISTSCHNIISSTMGKRKRKNRTHLKGPEQGLEQANGPKSFVIRVSTNGRFRLGEGVLKFNHAEFALNPLS
jgi:hypothetical protein